MQDIKPIETEYAGIYFRSRLEARWAMLFDKLNIAWEYEPEAYEYRPWDGEVWRYLPDFYLPEHGYWCEVKGNTESVTDDYLTMLGCVGHFLPNVHNSSGHRGVILLSGIPYRRDDDRDESEFLNLVPAFTCVSHYKGCQTAWVTIDEQGVRYDRDRGFRFNNYTSDNFSEESLAEIRPNVLWEWSAAACNGSAKHVWDAYATVRRHRFWNPK